MLKFSILIPSYNSAGYILKTLDSVKCQSYTDFELIITDNGSTDATPDIIENYAKENPGLKILLKRQESLGIGKARNEAFRLSSGDIISFLDDDDIWYPDRLYELAQYWQSHPEVDLLSHKVYKRYPDSRLSDLPTEIPKQDCFRTLLFKGNTIAISATSVRREAFVEAGCFRDDLQGAEDYELWLRLAYKGCKFGYLDKYLGEIARRPEGYSLGRIPHHLEGVLRVIDEYSDKLQKEKPSQAKSISIRTRLRKAREAASSTIKLLRKNECKSALKLVRLIMRLLFSFHKVD